MLRSPLFCAAIFMGRQIGFAPGDTWVNYSKIKYRFTIFLGVTWHMVLFHNKNTDIMEVRRGLVGHIRVLVLFTVK